jgi:hypothetical protein
MMNQIAIGGMILAMLAVLAVLATGLITMARGKDISGEKSNKLMWWRIYAQAIALAFFAVVLMLAKK